MGHLRRTSTLVLAVAAVAVLSTIAAQAKGIAPQSLQCDQFAKTSGQWSDCISAQRQQQTDAELFYAGYWLAKNGRYAEALQYLIATKLKNERVLTYIGYAKRKSGGVSEAMGYYAKALALNPDYTIARSYLGEAHLVLGNLNEARAQLSEIATRCGMSCAEYKELNDAIANHLVSPS